MVTTKVRRELDAVDMEDAGVSGALVKRLRGLIQGCNKGDKDDELLDEVFAMWRHRR